MILIVVTTMDDTRDGIPWFDSMLIIAEGNVRDIIHVSPRLAYLLFLPFNCSLRVFCIQQSKHTLVKWEMRGGSVVHKFSVPYLTIDSLQCFNFIHWTQHTYIFSLSIECQVSSQMEQRRCQCFTIKILSNNTSFGKRIFKSISSCTTNWFKATHQGQLCRRIHCWYVYGTLLFM